MGQKERLLPKKGGWVANPTFVVAYNFVVVVGEVMMGTLILVGIILGPILLNSGIRSNDPTNLTDGTILLSLALAGVGIYLVRGMVACIRTRNHYNHHTQPRDVCTIFERHFSLIKPLPEYVVEEETEEEGV